MGLTNSSIGIKTVDSGMIIKKQTDDDRVIAIAGNPNVGKSTVFNALTGMNQHTGNWPGKTVTSAQGYCSTENNNYVLIDIPGTYSLMAHSPEEEVARNFICFAEPDAVAIVCDATCLERNLNLVLQTMEITDKVVVCINLMDEAKRKNICIDTEKLSERLGVPVVGTVARKKKTLKNLTDAFDMVNDKEYKAEPIKIIYPDIIECAINMVEPVLKARKIELNTHWLALKLIDSDASLLNEINTYCHTNFEYDTDIQTAVKNAREYLSGLGIGMEQLKDLIVASLVHTTECICDEAVVFNCKCYDAKDRRIDKVLTNKWSGYPIMLLVLALIFWITISGANYPSKLLADGMFYLQDKLTELFIFFNAPEWLHGALVLGVYRVLAWVVSVMLPPMAIFFPLFTLLEDAGFLPRIAYNLDRPFKSCCACGKQALTMCMGFGCNAAGIVGCRIIDSPRERLLAILTNNFVPCNGRFPTLIAIITMFFIGTAGGVFSTALSAVMLTATILLGILVTFGATKLLSKTLLKGISSSFTLELPPYRRPQVGRVIVRSIFERTLFVLGRAVAVAAPAGLVIWIMANINIGNMSVLNYCANVLDPFARLMGLDGVILIAFILGFPANEIVIPIVIMAYMAQGSIIELDSVMQMKSLFVENGWSWITAISFMLFSLMHWPCSTTIITIKKETGSWKWTLFSAIIPTVMGVICCIVFATVARLFV